MTIDWEKMIPSIQKETPSCTSSEELEWVVLWLVVDQQKGMGERKHQNNLSFPDWLGKGERDRFRRRMRPSRKSH